MVSECLPFDALLQHLPSYLGFSYLERRVSLQGCSSKAQPLLLTLDEGYLRRAVPPDIERGVAPLGPPEPTQQPLLGAGIAPLGRGLWPPGWGSSSRPPPLTSDVGKLLWAAPPALPQSGTLGHYPWPWARLSSSRPCFCVVRRSRRASPSPKSVPLQSSRVYSLNRHHLHPHYHYFNPCSLDLKHQWHQ